MQQWFWKREIKGTENEKTDGCTVYNLLQVLAYLRKLIHQFASLGSAGIFYL